MSDVNGDVVEAPWSELLGWNTLELGCLEMWSLKVDGLGFTSCSFGVSICCNISQLVKIRKTSLKQTVQHHGGNPRARLSWMMIGNDIRESYPKWYRSAFCCTSLSFIPIAWLVSCRALFFVLTWSRKLEKNMFTLLKTNQPARKLVNTGTWTSCQKLENSLHASFCQTCTKMRQRLTAKNSNAELWFSVHYCIQSMTVFTCLYMLL